MLELDVLVADFGVARPIEARRRPEIQLWTQIKVLYFTSVSGKRSAFWFKSEILHFCFHRHVCIYALLVPTLIYWHWAAQCILHMQKCTY